MSPVVSLVSKDKKVDEAVDSQAEDLGKDVEDSRFELLSPSTSAKKGGRLRFFHPSVSLN